MDHEEFFSTSPNVRIFERSVRSLKDIYIVGSIREPAEYLDAIDSIRSSGPNDVVVIHINSQGGDMFTVLQIRAAIIESPATTVGVVEGNCLSAATVIFLACQHHEIMDHSVFMFHNYTSGTVGKGGEMHDAVIHARKWSENLWREIYADFLTEKEIQSILENKDLWMDVATVSERLNKREKKLTKAAKTLTS